MRPGLCERCVFARRVASKRGPVYWNCRAPGLPKYPALPVIRCAGFEPLEPAEA